MPDLDAMARECADEFYNLERKIGNVKGGDGEALVIACIPVLVGILKPFARTYAIAVIRDRRDRCAERARTANETNPFMARDYDAAARALGRMADELESDNEQ